MADYELHTAEGIAMTGLHTVPDSSIRNRAAGISMPTLLVAGVRETSFAEAQNFAVSTIPGLEVAELDVGHAVNLEAAERFNSAVEGFFAARARLAEAYPEKDARDG
jgi:pimeloyl-ACP methyl ester carboxylesterase